MALRSLSWPSVVQCLVLILASLDVFVCVQGNCKDFDFENGLGSLSKWTKTGHAFDNQPTYKDNPNARNPKIKTNVQGEWWIGTFENRSNPTAEPGYVDGDFPVGTLTSPKFRITGPNINFLFGGGCEETQIRAELLVNGKLQRTTFSDNCRERMRRRMWNVAQFKNQIAQIRLVDGSRKGHVNFDDLRGDFVCVDEETSPLKSNTPNGRSNEEVVVIDDPLEFSNQSDKHPGHPLTGTEDDFNAVRKPLSQQKQDGPAIIAKGTPQHKGLLGGGKANDNVLTSLQASPAKILKAPLSLKRIGRLRLRDPAKKALQPQDDELRNLTCTNYLVKIKTGLLWDNDFLFESNGNYQATRREMEIKVLDTYEDDKDFRGAFFRKFSSSQEPGQVKAYFVLRFRAKGKYLGKLLDKLGDGNVSAAGCYDDAVTHCPSACPSSCAPLCQASCCQPSVAVVTAPQPVPVTQCPNGCPSTCAPSCQASCCEPSVTVVTAPQPVPVTQCPNSCPSRCAPSCQASCCQQSPSAVAAPQLPLQPAPIAQCPNGCPPRCAPSCQASCCQQSPSAVAAPQLPLQPAPIAQCPNGCPSRCAPSCQASCCQSSPSVVNAPQQPFQLVPLAQCPNGCPSRCAPSCQASCCQQPPSVVNAPQQPFQPVPLMQCPNGCPPRCAPSCQASCCQSSPSAVTAPQQPFQPVTLTQCPNGCPPRCAPSCQASCCQSSPSALTSPQPPQQPLQPVPLTQCPNGCPPKCAPSCQASCCQSTPQAAYQPFAQRWNQQSPVQAAASQYPMSQPMSWPGPQCPTGCSPNCAPICSPLCCQFFKRGDSNIKTNLKKQHLEEEKRNRINSRRRYKYV